jgi:predicted nucleotidyltransferase
MNTFLLSLEKQHNIQIIFAVECGSRLYGTNSNASDYDIRGVYLHNDILKRNQLLLNNNKNISINGFSDDKTYDYELFDLLSFIKLIKENNFMIIDWVNSNICYIGNKELKIIKYVFNNTFCINNYLIKYYGFMVSTYMKQLNPERKQEHCIINKKIYQGVNLLIDDLLTINDNSINKGENILNRSIDTINDIKSLMNTEIISNNQPICTTTIKQMLLFTRIALYLEYILQHNQFPPLNMNILLNTVDIDIDIDKQLIYDLINKKRNNNTDEYVCYEWITHWFNKLEKQIKPNLNKFDIKKIDNPDMYIQYYLDCIDRHL